MIVFKIKIKSILKGIRKIKPLKAITSVAKGIPGVGSIVGEAEKLYTAQRSQGKSVAGAVLATAGELEHEKTMGEQAQALVKDTPFLLLVGAGILVLFLVFRRGR